jgi:ACS family hexuronate transporter-like MFS transporter
MFLAYGGSMLCRSTIGALSPAMAEDPEIMLSASQLGEILAWGAVGSIVGKIFSGIVADLIGGRLALFVCVITVAISTMAFSLPSSVLLFSLIHFVMRVSQTIGWPAAGLLINQWFPKQHHGKCWGIMATSSRIHTALSAVLLGILVAAFGWRSSFVIAGSFYLVASFIFLYFIEPSPTKAGLKDLSEGVEHTSLSETLKSIFKWLLILKKDLCFVYILLAMMMLYVLYDFVGYAPLYLNQATGLSAADAAKASAFFPLGALSSVLIFGFLYDRLKFKNVRLLVVGLIGLSTLSVGLLWSLSSFELSTGSTQILSFILIFSFGFTFAPAYWLPVNVYVTGLGGYHIGFTLALVDVFGYISSAIFNVVAGRLAESGWGSYLLFVMAFCAFATIFLFLFFREMKKRL